MRKWFLFCLLLSVSISKRCMSGQATFDDLTRACEENDVATVALCLAENPEWVHCQEHGDTLFAILVLRGHVESIKLFIDKGVDVNKVSRALQMFPLQIALLNKDIEAVQLLLAHENIDLYQKVVQKNRITTVHDYLDITSDKIKTLFKSCNLPDRLYHSKVNKEK